MTDVTTATEPRRTAVFEAAIASVHAKEGGTGKLVRISIVPTSNISGSVQFVELERVLSTAEMQKQVIIALAGPVAEQKLLGVKGGERGRLCFESALYSVERIIMLTEDCDDEVAFREKVVARLREWHAETEKLVDKHRDAILRLADALEAKQEMTGEEALAIINA